MFGDYMNMTKPDTAAMRGGYPASNLARSSFVNIDKAASQASSNEGCAFSHLRYSIARTQPLTRTEMRFRTVPIARKAKAGSRP